MTVQHGRVSVWYSREDAPHGCACRSREVTESTRVQCAGTYGGPQDCPGLDGWIGPGGAWCAVLHPLPPQSPALNPQLYDAHARRAAEVFAAGEVLSLAAACRQAVAEMGRGHGWGADDGKTGVPDRLYRRAKQFLSEYDKFGVFGAV